MPELPEAETIRRHLEPELADRQVETVRVHFADLLLDGPDIDAFTAAIAGRRIEGVGRRAKFPLLRLDDGAVLEVQLRMSGRLLVSRERPDPDLFDHLGAEFELDDGRTLWYDDTRRLGGFRLWDRDGWRARTEQLGPEPMAEGFTPERLQGILEGRRAPVKNVLMDQRRVAGIGNLYAAEILFASGVDPRRPAGSLGRVEVADLHATIRDTLRRAIRSRGTTFRDFRWSSEGRMGGYQEQLAVYGRAGEACPGCGELVRRILQAGRSTYFCPVCQS